MSRLRSGWGLRIDRAEVNARPRLFFDIANETNASRTREDEYTDSVWVLYETRDERDDAYYAFAESFHSVKRGESRFDYE